MTVTSADAIAKGAREAALDFGIQRLTMSDVARRAGVSRQTIYRHHSDVQAVLRELIGREFREAVEAARTVEGRHGRARIVARIGATVRALRANALVEKALDVDAELLLPYLVDRLGSTQLYALGLITEDVAIAQRDGSCRDGDPQAISLSLLLIAQTFTFFRGATPGVSEEELLVTLDGLIDGALKPTTEDA